MVKTRAQWN
jgi:hypothetical protein